MFKIYALGVNYKSVRIEERERVSCPLKEFKEVVPLLKTTGVEEFFLLSTCNRTEIYCVSSSKENVENLLYTYLSYKGELPLKERFFLLEGEEALFHIFKVASGLDSMVLGEPQIVSQFKESFLECKRLGSVGKILNLVFQRAMRANKRVRSETEVSKGAVSVSYVAVELAKSIFPSVEGIKVLLVGAGEMGELASTYFKREGAKLYITNRTISKAKALAKKLGGEVVPFNSFKEFLSYIDVALFSTGAGKYLVNRKELTEVMERRNYKPLFIIDISVPRNVEPSSKEIDELFLYDIDDLKEVAQKNLKGREREKLKGEAIVLEEVEKFFRGLELLKVEEVLIRLSKLIKVSQDKALRKSLYRAIRQIREEPKLAERFYRVFEPLLEKSPLKL